MLKSSIYLVFTRFHELCISCLMRCSSLLKMPIWQMRLTEVIFNRPKIMQGQESNRDWLGSGTWALKWDHRLRGRLWLAWWLSTGYSRAGTKSQDLWLFNSDTCRMMKLLFQVRMSVCLYLCLSLPLPTSLLPPSPASPPLSTPSPSSPSCFSLTHPFIHIDFPDPWPQCGEIETLSSP